MPHPLDNPVWHALTGPHADIALGTGLARHYPRDIAPFSAVAEDTAAAHADLAADLPPGPSVPLFRPGNEAAPPGWENVEVLPIVQMVADGVLPSRMDRHGAPDLLGAEDADAMLALVALTKPGPFARRTYLLGGFAGYRAGGQLRAMGGERLRLPGYVELSAICVDPAARGTGLGAALVSHLAQRALARGEIPFLHVFPDNPAMRLYHGLGFRERARLWVIWRRPATGA